MKNEKSKKVYLMRFCIKQKKLAKKRDPYETIINR